MKYAQFIFDRGVRLAAGLAVVVAIPMAVLFYFQFKSLNDLEETSAVVLRQLSSDTAESLTRAVEDYLKRPHISVLLRIPQARTEPLDLAVIDTATVERDERHSVAVLHVMDQHLADAALHGDTVMTVGVTGFEPVAPRSQSECATKLRHTPSGRV